MPTSPTAKWTAAVYLAGGENVTREMIPGLHDLRDVSLANTGTLSTLAQFEPGGAAPRLLVFDDGLLPRLHLEANSRALAPTPTGLANYEHPIPLPAIGPGRSYALLEGFLERARAAAASEGPLLVVISGHGSGAVGEFLGYRGSAKDVTSSYQQQKDASRLAQYDSLTGLSNRHRMSKRLHAILTAYQQSKRSCALMMPSPGRGDCARSRSTRGWRRGCARGSSTSMAASGPGRSACRRCDSWKTSWRSRCPSATTARCARLTFGYGRRWMSMACDLCSRAFRLAASGCRAIPC